MTSTSVADEARVVEAVADSLPGDERSVEMQVLICSARSELSPAHRLRMRELLETGPDWERLHELAVLHKLAPLLHWHLRDFADVVPSGTRRFLNEYFLANTRRAFEVTRELLALIGALAAEGVLCVPYKGPSLAAEAYGNIVLRPTGDLDLVVRRKDLPRVRALLRVRGYLPEHTLDNAGEELTEKSLYHEAFQRADGLVVEVHWAFTDIFPGFSLNLESLERRLVSVSLGGQTVHGFAREDLLLILCVHGAKHRWCRLEWMAGVAELLRAPAALDWSKLLERADDLGSRRILFLGLRMAHEVLEAPLPDRVRRLVVQDEIVARLAALSRCHVLNTSDRWKELQLAPRDVYYLHLNERRRDQLRFVLHRLTTPSQAKSWRGLRIGRFYLPLHALIRPFQAGKTLMQTFQWYLSPRKDL